jgi:hypothetical protein
MNPFFSKEMADQHIRDLRREAAKGRAQKRRAQGDGLTVRAATLRDGEAVRVLAALEGVGMPKGPVLVAEVGHEVVAALPLQGGRALADPFRPSAHLVELLQLRAKQLHAQSRTPRLPRLRGVLHTA